MNKLTAQEIIEKLKESELEISDFAHEQIRYFGEDQAELDRLWREEKKTLYNDASTLKLEKEARIKAKNRYISGGWEEIDQYGGEGQGDNWWSVKYFPEHDVYLKVHGSYQSYDGTYFDGWSDVKEVKPVQKTITVY